LVREVGDRHYEAALLAQLAELLHAHGSFDEALDRCEQALLVYRAIGDRSVEGELLGLREKLLIPR
jgi:hypothetical protein